MAETNAQRKRRRIIPNTIADAPPTPLPAAVTSTPIAQEQVAPDRSGQGGVFSSAVGRGLRQTQGIGQGLLGAAGAAVGADEFAEEQIAAGQESFAKGAQSSVGVRRVEDITDLNTAAEFVTNVAGEQLPILATTFGGGAAGVAARSRLPAAVQRRVSAPAAATTGAVGAGVGLETGSIFQDIASDPESRENFSLREIAGISAVGGTAAGSLEALPVISAFKRFGLGKSATRAIRSSLAKRVAKGTAAQAGLEAGTEGAQTIIERAAAKFANENREILGEEGFSEIINAMAGGLVLGGPIGGLSAGFQRGSIEDQLDIEESLDELDQTGGRSTDIDADLDGLGGLGLDIRASRQLASETELVDEPEKVIARIMEQANESGGIPSRRAFGQLTEAIRNLENPAQLDNILAEVGISENLRPQLAGALRAEVEGQNEDHLSLAVDERDPLTIGERIEQPGDFQSPNVTNSHILRNRNGKLGFVPANDPQQENALRSTLDNLEQDFPDITFKTVGLGDAVADSLPEATRKDPEKARRVLLDVANEKRNEVGFNNSRFAELDSARPRDFLNQFKAIAKEEVDVSLTGRDEFRLTDSDLVGGTRPAVVQVGGPVKSNEGVAAPKATVSQGKARPIFVKREAGKQGDFSVDARGTPQTVDGIALTNRMLVKERHQGPVNTQTAANAFFNGLSALVQRGVKIDETSIPDSLVIHKGRGSFGREITWGEAKAKGSGRIRARILALKTRQREIGDQVADVAKNLKRASPAAQRRLKELQRKLKRRAKQIPTEIETLNVFGKSVSREVGDLTARLNNASELLEAAGNETEGLADIAIEIQDLTRQLEREGFNTQAAEDLSKIGDQLQGLDELATDEQREARRQKARTGEQASLGREEKPDTQSAAEEQGKRNVQETLAKLRSRDVVSSAVFARSGGILDDINDMFEKAKELVEEGVDEVVQLFDDVKDTAEVFKETAARIAVPEIDPQVQESIVEQFNEIRDKFGATNARIVTGNEVAFILRDLELEFILTEFVSGQSGGYTITRPLTVKVAKELILNNSPGMSDVDAVSLAVTIMKRYKEIFDGADHIVLVNPFIGDETLVTEILSHEMGHVIFKNFYSTASKETQDALVADFHKWQKDLGRVPKGKLTVGAAFASKRTFETALTGMLGTGQSRVQEFNHEDLDYLWDFEEWFADNTARYLVPEPSQPLAQSRVDKFFKDVADSTRKLFEQVAKIFGFKPAPSVKAFLDDIIHSKPEIELSLAHSNVGVSAAKLGLDSDNKGIAAIFQSIDPFGRGMNYSMREVMKDNLKPAERRVIFKYFNRRATKTRLKGLTDNARQKDMIENSPLHAAAYGYQMWIAGTFELQKPSAETAQQAQAASGGSSLAGAVLSIFTNLFDAISARLGFVYESEQVEQILDAVRDGVITARKAGTDDFSVVTAVRGDVLQRVAQSGNRMWEDVAPFFDKMLGTAQQRMLDSGVPAFNQIANNFFTAVGTEGQEKSFFEARKDKIGEFMNRYTRVTQATRGNNELKLEVLGLLRNPKKQGSAEAIKVASNVRKLLRMMRNYIEKSGVEIGDRGKDYFPWVFDPRKIQDQSDFVRKLLADDRFDVNMQGILDNLNIRRKAQDDEAFAKAKNAFDRLPDIEKRTTAKFKDPRRGPITKEELIEHIMMGLEQSEGLADTNLNPEVAGTVPFFGAMNKRTLGFLAEGDKLTEAEREQFDGLFSDQLDLIMMTYIRQSVKRTEYSTRFAPDSSGLTRMLDEAREEGATSQQMIMAHKYIDAMTGVIGEGTNNRVSKTLGLGKRQGEVINPHWRSFTSIAMVLQNLAVLPLATFTSLVDPVGILVRSQDLRATMVALRTGASEIANEVKLLVGNDEKAARSELRQLAEAMGTIEDHMTNEALEWEYGSTYLTPRLKLANEFFFKAIGLTQWTRVTRLMALAGGKEFLKRHVQRPNENSERFLDQLNLEADDVKFDSEGGIQILTRLERENPDLAEGELARDDRVRNALNRFVDESILRPNAAQRPIWASDPNWALIFHLKSFMFSFHDRILRRAAQEAEFGNTAPMMLLAVFIPAMLFADVLRDLIQFGFGGNPRKASWGLEDHMWSATQRSGLNGIGQLLIDAKQDVQFGGIGYESLAGPTVDGIGDLTGLFSDDDEAQWNAFVRNLPGSSAWKHWLENGFDES